MAVSESMSKPWMMLVSSAWVTGRGVGIRRTAWDSTTPSARAMENESWRRGDSVSRRITVGFWLGRSTVTADTTAIRKSAEAGVESSGVVIVGSAAVGSPAVGCSPA